MLSLLHPFEIPIHLPSSNLIHFLFDVQDPSLLLSHVLSLESLEVFNLIKRNSFVCTQAHIFSILLLVLLKLYIKGFA